MAKTQEENLERSLGFLLHDVSRLVRKAFDRRVAALGLTRSQWWVLAYVFRDQGLTQSELAEVLDVGKVTLGGLIDRLETKGWLERRADQSDRRIRRIYLKAAAEPVIESMRAPAQDLYDALLAGLSPDEQEGLIDTLILLKGNLLADDAAPSRHREAAVER